MTWIRCAVVAALVPVAGVVPAVPVAATPVAPIGQLAYITTAGVLDVLNVNPDGSTSFPQRLGPITTVQSPKTVKVSSMVASADGSRLAWSEVISKPDPTYGSLETGAVLVVRNMFTRHDVSLRSEYVPLGFAGHRLVVLGAHTKRLVMSPSPHLVKVHDHNAYPNTTYSGGIVDTVLSLGGHNDTVETDRLRLTTFGGHHKLLHTYQVGMTYRSVAANTYDAVSPDGRKLIVERGNHQDFSGLGPSSLFDTYSMGGGYTRHALGHFGTNRAKWRLAGATFVGANDTPWLALHSDYVKTANGYVVHGVVVRYAHGRWQKESSSAVAVAGLESGWVVIQGGVWNEVPDSPDGEYAPSPTFPALLKGPHGFHHTLADVQGTQILWVG
ncbi:MAG TPA: hypothetical protein VHE56_00990 [Mycobacteriales bacterium]|nr:hypothetical protein [Mycobacteriales bacterium]